jgi:hypothetical protein
MTDSVAFLACLCLTIAYFTPSLTLQPSHSRLRTFTHTCTLTLPPSPFTHATHTHTHTPPQSLTELFSVCYDSKLMDSKTADLYTTVPDFRTERKTKRQQKDEKRRKKADGDEEKESNKGMICSMLLCLFHESHTTPIT